MVAGKNIKIGEIAVGYKMRNTGWHECAEDQLVEKLGGNSDDIIFSRAYRPRTGKFKAVCKRCQTKYKKSQFAPGTEFE